MNPNRAEEVFLSVLDRPIEDRAEALEALCGPDATLRAEVESLLRADAAPGSLMSPRVNATADDGTVAAGPHRAPLLVGEGTIGEKAGDVIDHYKLLQQIGEGGFGVVFMAQQLEPVKRKVALKIIKLGMDTKEVIARFEAERQALAMMDHPNIAKVFDAGATNSGRPYFVMELVRGVAVTEFCDTNKLSTLERLRLFQQICNAIQHAHQKGVIHRDLKPKNVLVSLLDGEPMPKVIDFGIAKATNAELTERTLFTQFRQFIGTPEYMSPEQATMSVLDVDTRSDIYSLGVLLYELLTGTTPFDGEKMRQLGYAEMEKMIRDEEPPRPSTRVSTLGEKLTAVAKQRQVEPPRLSGLLKGDLDWIVMKAMEKDRRRRYSTASDFAQDIQRHLVNEPVLARAPSTTYRMRKFVQRNTKMVAAATIVAAVLVLGIIGTSIGLVAALNARRAAEADATRALAAQHAEAQSRKKAEDATARAQEEAENAKAVSGFFETMFTSVDPIGLGRTASGSVPGTGTDDGDFYRSVGAPLGPSQQVTVLELLNRALPTVEKAFDGRPAMEAAVRQTIGRTLFGLGLPWEADTQLKKSIEAWTKVRGLDHPDTLVAIIERAEEMLTNFGFMSQAAAMLTKAASGLEKALGPEDRRTLRAKMLLASALSRDSSMTEQVLGMAEESSRIFDRVSGPEDRDSIHAKIVLAGVQAVIGRDTEAERTAREAVDRAQRLFGAENYLTLQARRALGVALHMRGRCQESVEVLRPLVLDLARVLGPMHVETLRVGFELSKVYDALGQSMKHAELCRSMAADMERDRGKDDPWSIRFLSSAAFARAQAGDVMGAAREIENLLPRVDIRDEGGGKATTRGFLRSQYMRLFSLAKEPRGLIPSWLRKWSARARRTRRTPNDSGCSSRLWASCTPSPSRTNRPWRSFERPRRFDDPRYAGSPPSGGQYCLGKS
jgi:serine/threonine protein kinase